MRTAIILLTAYSIAATVYAYQYHERGIEVAQVKTTYGNDCTPDLLTEKSRTLIMDCGPQLTKGVITP